MNKAELIANVAEKTGFTKKDAERAINAMMDSIKEELVQGGKVQLVGFGTFEVRNRKERTGRNRWRRRPTDRRFRRRAARRRSRR